MQSLLVLPNLQQMQLFVQHGDVSEASAKNHELTFILTDKRNPDEAKQTTIIHHFPPHISLRTVVEEESGSDYSLIKLRYRSSVRNVKESSEGIKSDVDRKSSTPYRIVHKDPYPFLTVVDQGLHSPYRVAQGIFHECRQGHGSCQFSERNQRQPSQYGFEVTTTSTLRGRVKLKSTTCLSYKQSDGTVEYRGFCCANCGHRLSGSGRHALPQTIGLLPSDMWQDTSDLWYCHGAETAAVPIHMNVKVTKARWLLGTNDVRVPARVFGGREAAVGQLPTPTPEQQQPSSPETQSSDETEPSSVNGVRTSKVLMGAVGSLPVQNVVGNLLQCAAQRGQSSPGLPAVVPDDDMGITESLLCDKCGSWVGYVVSDLPESHQDQPITAEVRLLKHAVEVATWTQDLTSQVQTSHVFCPYTLERFVADMLLQLINVHLHFKFLLVAVDVNAESDCERKQCVTSTALSVTVQNPNLAVASDDTKHVRSALRVAYTILERLPLPLRPTPHTVADLHGDVLRYREAMRTRRTLNKCNHKHGSDHHHTTAHSTTLSQEASKPGVCRTGSCISKHTTSSATPKAQSDVSAPTTPDGKSSQQHTHDDLGTQTNACNELPEERPLPNTTSEESPPSKTSTVRTSHSSEDNAPSLPLEKSDSKLHNDDKLKPSRNPQHLPSCSPTDSHELNVDAIPVCKKEPVQPVGQSDSTVETPQHKESDDKPEDPINPFAVLPLPVYLPSPDIERLLNCLRSNSLILPVSSRKLDNTNVSFLRR